MKQQYRINRWRFDVRKRTYSTPVFEGATREDCDKQAVDHFHQMSNKPENKWDGMEIVRIDSPAVKEKVTFLDKNGRQEGDDD